MCIFCIFLKMVYPLCGCEYSIYTFKGYIKVIIGNFFFLISVSKQFHFSLTKMLVHKFRSLRMLKENCFSCYFYSLSCNVAASLSLSCSFLLGLLSGLFLKILCQAL